MVQTYYEVVTNELQILLNNEFYKKKERFLRGVIFRKLNNIKCFKSFYCEMKNYINNLKKLNIFYLF